MQEVSADFLAAVRSPNRQFKSSAAVSRTGFEDIIFDDSVITKISRKDAAVTGNQFEIGSVVSATCEVTLKNLDGSLSGICFGDAQVMPSIGVLLAGGQYEYCPLGIFYVQSVEKADGEVKLYCYDGMIKLEKLYVSNLSYPATLLNIAGEIAAIAGLSLKYSYFQNCNITVPENPGLAGATLRQALSWVAEAAGCFARVNRDGKIDIAWYGNTDEALNVNNYYELSMADTDSRPYDGVVIKKSGDDMNGVSDGTCKNPYQIVANPLLTQNQSSAIKAIYNEFNGFTYRPFAAVWQGNPALDSGDGITVAGKDGEPVNTIVTNSELYYDGGVKSVLKAVLENEISAKSADGTLSSSIKKVVKEQTNIKNLMVSNLSAVNASIQNLAAEKADVDSLTAATARISTLETNSATIAQLDAANADISSLQTGKLNASDASATYATITNLSAANANISNLQTDKLNVNDAQATYATIANLSSANGNIGSLQSDNAKIINLLSDNAGIDYLSSQSVLAAYAALANASLGDAQITNLTAAAIESGTVDTSKVTISGTGGNLSIADNTIQIKDADRTRVQIGKDASSDYNMYVWDASGNLMFDAAGLHADGIKDKIIRDDMVSDTANINAAKLDINSLYSQINGSSGTLKSSKIYLDTQAQTLDLAFNSLSNTVSDQGTALSDQGTSISALQGDISLKVWETDIKTAVNNLQVNTTNILQKTNPTSGTPIWCSINPSCISSSGIVSDSSARYGCACHILHDSSTTNAGYYWPLNYLTVGQVYTWSFYAKGSGTFTEVGSEQNGAKSIALTSNYQQYSYTFTANSNTYHQFVFYTTSANAEIYFYDLTLTLGNKATGWSPAPEDVQTQITTNSTEITQTANKLGYEISSDSWKPGGTMDSMQSSINDTAKGLSLKVSSSDYNGNIIASLINQTSKSISLNAINVDLSGFVTFSSLETQGTTTINGSNITTGTISADRIDTTNLCAVRLNSSSGYYANIGQGVLNNDNYGLKLFNSSGTAMGELMLRSEDTNIDAAVGLLAQQDLYLGVNNYNTYIQVDGVYSGTISLNASTINSAGQIHCPCGYPHIYGDGSYLQLAHTNYNKAGLVLQANCARPACDNADNLGASNVRWKQLYAVTSTIATSDRNEKNTINPLGGENASKFIMALNPVSYKFNDGDSGRTHYGMISQDVEQELCELNMTSLDFAGFIKSPQEDGSYRYGLRYEEFIAPLIAVAKYQNNRIGDDETRIAALESRIAGMQALLYAKS